MLLGSFIFPRTSGLVPRRLKWSAVYPELATSVHFRIAAAMNIRVRLQSPVIC